MHRKVIFTPNAPAPVGPYSQAIRVGNLIFVAGQIPLDHTTGIMPEGITGQTRLVLHNLAAVVEAAGGALTDVVKTTVYLKDMREFAAMNEVYGEFFRDKPPARATVEVARLPKDALVEIEAIAVIASS